MWVCMVVVLQWRQLLVAALRIKTRPTTMVKTKCGFSNLKDFKKCCLSHINSQQKGMVFRKWFPKVWLVQVLPHDTDNVPERHTITESDVVCALPSRYFSFISRPLSTPVTMAAKSWIQTAPLWVETFRKWWETTVIVCVRWGVDALCCDMQLLQRHMRLYISSESSSRVRRSFC